MKGKVGGEGGRGDTGLCTSVLRIGEKKEDESRVVGWRLWESYYVKNMKAYRLLHNDATRQTSLVKILIYFFIQENPNIVFSLAGRGNTEKENG